jgi:hypothetical protein
MNLMTILRETMIEPEISDYDDVDYEWIASIRQ